MTGEEIKAELRALRKRHAFLKGMRLRHTAEVAYIERGEGQNWVVA